MTQSHAIRNVVCATAVCLALIGVGGERLRAYTLLGHKWTTNQVLYYVNARNNYISDAVAIAAIQNAASNWTAQTGANIQFVYAGTTSGNSFVDNHKNEVFFRTDSTSPGGETYWWADKYGNLVDADISFNQGRYQFTADGLPCSGGINLQDFATHEFGHALGLRHSALADATMYPTMPAWCDTSWRSLSADDISGVQAIYPGGPVPTVPTAPTSSTSPDGTMVPTVTQIVDGQGAVWTIGGGGTILRNGAAAAGGYGSKILWSGGVIYVLGTDGKWWSWSGSGWTYVGSAPGTGSTGAEAPANGTSPDGTMVPTATQIVDGQGAVWTIGGGAAILRNGAAAAGGYGSKILWSGGVIYVFGTDAKWWRWTGSGWTNVGSTQPGPSTSGASPDGTVVPTVAQIVDNQGAVWTIGSGAMIFRNGVSAAGGAGSKLLWSNGIVYAYGTDGAWWRWNGTWWITLGSLTPGGASSDGTMVPTVAQIVDNQGAVWTIGGGTILRNGVLAAGGYGSKILWSGGVIYVFGTDSNWWQWSGSGWTNVGKIF